MTMITIFAVLYQPDGHRLSLFVQGLENVIQLARFGVRRDIPNTICSYYHIITTSIYCSRAGHSMTTSLDHISKRQQTSFF